MGSIKDIKGRIYKITDGLQHPSDTDLMLEPRRVRIVSLVEKILSVTSDDARTILDQYPRIMEKLQSVCAIMVKKNRYWSRVSLLELTLEELASLMGGSKNSSLKFCSPIDINQKERRNQAVMRTKFLDALYELVPSNESSTFDKLLTVRTVVPGLPDDAGAVDTLNKLERAYNTGYAELENLLFDRGESTEGRNLAPARISDLAVAVTTDLERSIHTIRKNFPSSTEDSLAARLILNASVNRAILELDELTRLHEDAFSSAVNIVHLLASIDPIVMTNQDTDNHVFAFILKAFTLHPSEITEPAKWKNVSMRERRLIMARTHQLLERFCIERSLDRVTAFRKLHFQSQNKLLMASCLAWAYCTGMEHDLRVTGMKHPKQRIVHSRSASDELDIPASMLTLVLRLYSLLFYSNQHLHFSKFALNDYSMAVHVKRSLLRKLFAGMKHATLVQWTALNELLRLRLSGTVR